MKLHYDDMGEEDGRKYIMIHTRSFVINVFLAQLVISFVFLDSSENIDKTIEEEAQIDDIFSDIIF